MNVRTWQVRLFVAGQQVFTATEESGKWRHVGETINNKWRVLKVERKPNSGDFNPPPPDGELWIEAEPVSDHAAY
jgi:hypothetical protein